MQRRPSPLRFHVAFFNPAIASNCLLGLLSRLASLSAAGLRSGGLLLGLLRLANSAHTGNSLLAEVGTVVLLGGLVGNTLVDPE